MKDVQKSDFESYQNLTAYLCNKQTDEEKKVKNIHLWITNYMSLDPKLIRDESPTLYPNPEEIYNRGKTDDRGFVVLMKAMLDEAAIESEVIRGYTRAYETDSTIYPAFTDHWWLVVKVNNEWRLADPAMDAGYVGPKRTKKIERLSAQKAKNKKKFDRKMHGYYLIQKSDRETEFKLLSKKREAKTKENYISRQFEIEAKADRKPDFKKKIVFQRRASEANFLIRSDTFLLSHLPANPMWQLRCNPISLPVFLTGPEQIRNDISTGKGLDYLQEINHYLALNETEKLMEEALKVIHYNKENTKVMAENFYLIQSGNFNGRSSDVAENTDQLSVEPQFHQTGDSIKKYTDKSYKTITHYYKSLHQFFKTQNKVNSTIADDQIQMLQKSITWNQKAEEEILNSWLFMERDLTKWSKIRNKLLPKSDLKYKTDSFDLSGLRALNKYQADSLLKLYESLNLCRELWCGKVRNSAIKDISARQKSQFRILRENNEYLRFKTYRKNTVILENSLVFKDEFDHIDLLYNLSLKDEMYCDDYVNGLSQFYNYVKTITSDLQKSPDNKFDSENRKAIGILDGYLQLQCDRFLADLQDANLFFFHLKTELKNIGYRWEKVIYSCERQIELNREKMSFLQKSLDSGQRKEMNTLYIISAELYRAKNHQGKSGEINLVRQNAEPQGIAQ